MCWLDPQVHPGMAPVNLTLWTERKIYRVIWDFEVELHLNVSGVQVLLATLTVTFHRFLAQLVEGEIKMAEEVGVDALANRLHVHGVLEIYVSRPACVATVKVQQVTQASSLKSEMSGVWQSRTCDSVKFSIRSEDNENNKCYLTKQSKTNNETASNTQSCRQTSRQTHWANSRSNTFLNIAPVQCWSSGCLGRHLSAPSGVKAIVTLVLSRSSALLGTLIVLSVTREKPSLPWTSVTTWKLKISTINLFSSCASNQFGNLRFNGKTKPQNIFVQEWTHICEVLQSKQVAAQNDA